MFVIFKKLTLTTFILISSQSLANTIEWSLSNAKVIHKNLVIPYGELAESTQQLAQNMNRLCQTPVNGIDQHTLEKVQVQFRNVYIDWAKVQFIQIGPMSYLQRKERFQYWPDKHNVASRQIRQLLKQSDDSKKIADVATLAKKSVAIQGLPALERLLFSNTATIDSARCHLGQLISQNLHIIAKDNYMAWISPPANFAHELLNPHPSLGIYPSHEAVAELLFAQLSTQLLVIKQLKLERALGRQGQYNKARKLEAWHSDLSLTLIKTNLINLQTLYVNGFHDHLSGINQPLAKKIATAFLSSIDIAKQHQSLYSLLQKKGKPEFVSQLIHKVTTLHHLIAGDALTALRFSAKFNALDGD